MTTTAGTAPSDVQDVISTDLSDAKLNSFLDDAEWEVADANDTDAMATADVVQLEKYVAALHVREWYDRAVEQADRESVSITYEGPSLQALRRAVDKRDPSGTIASTALRNGDRTVNSSTPS